MVTRRVSEESLTATKSSLTRRVTSSLLRFAVKVSAIRRHFKSQQGTPSAHFIYRRHRRQTGR